MRAPLTLRLVLTSAVLAGASTYAAEQQTLQHVKDLYAQAAYEDALGALSTLPASEPLTEAARYRAACLLALGRVEDAQKTVREVVTAHPEYRPDPAETSPRVLDLFRTERRAAAPDAARAMYATAKQAMERNEVGGAIERLESLIRLVDDPDFAGDSTLSDLKLLAGGFLDLLRLKAAGAKAEAAKTAAAPPRQPEAPPAAPPVITPAVPINQRVPSWTPPSALAAWELGGAVRVTIGPDGKVADAAIQKSVHPAYDTLLLTAARGWLYKPALKDGVPVASESTVTVVIKPR